MSVGIDEVRRIAALARIAIPDDRLPTLAVELSGILAHMAVLQKVETDSSPASSAMAPTPWRADHGPPIPLDRPVDAFAPLARDGFFVVPRLATHGGRSSERGASVGPSTDTSDDASADESGDLLDAGGSA